MSDLEQELGRAQARSASVDGQITRISATAGSLAQALASLIPHVHGDACPVCGRDFSEVSKEPLNAHLSGKIGSLTEDAGRLQALSREKASMGAAIANVTAERNQLQSRQISEDTRTQLKARRARLQELAQQLTDLGCRSGRPADAQQRRRKAERIRDLASHDRRRRGWSANPVR
jgi:exonuclease SbcC